MRRLHVLTTLTLIFLFFALTPHANAQFNASLQGTITDPTGALVPNAKIAAVNEATGTRYETVSSASGFYRIASLPPGKYTVTVEAATFATKVSNGIEVTAENPRGLNVTMVPGTTQQQVTVTEGEAVLQTENADVGSTLTARQVENLPQSGRDPYELLRLAPGVFGDAARNGSGQAIFLPNGVGPGGSNRSIFQVENQVQISANGQRVSGNNFNIDGVDVNSLTWGGAAVVTPNQESISEVTVVSTSYSAADGRGSGAQIKVVSKTGTNNWHGTGFLKYDEPGLNAFNNFAGWQGACCDTKAPTQRVETKERQFGGSLGGPIIKDKLFFFFSYEGLRRKNSDTAIEYIETPEFRNLLQSVRAGGVSTQIVAANGVEPRVVQLLTPSCADIVGACQPVSGGLDLGSPTGSSGQYVPLGNTIGGGFDGIPDVTRALIALPGNFDGNQYNARVDWNRGKDQFAVSTYITKSTSFSADSAAQGRPMADIRSKPTNPAITLLWNRAISNTVFNEARLNFSRFSFNDVDTNTDVNFGIPRSEIEGIFTDGSRLRFGAPRSETTPGVFAQNTYGFSDNLNLLLGRYALKFGFQMRKEQDNNNLLGGARPDYSSVRLWNFANDTPIFESINTDPRSGQPADAQRHFRSSDYSGFGQLDWKLRPNLTLNLGLRYEYFSPLTETDGRLTNIILPPIGQGLANAKVKVTDQLFEPDRNNFAPRLGFAWAPSMLNNKTVVRGGFGVAYNRIPDVLFSNTRGNPPFFARFNICCGTASTDFGTPFANGQILYALGASNSVNSYPTNPALVNNLDPNTNLPVNGTVEIWGTRPTMPAAYVYNYSLEVEHELPGQVTATIGYQGSSSHKLIRIVQQTFVRDDIQNTHANPIFIPTPDVTANYNALNLRVARKFSKGFTVDAKYRWSKSLDELSNEGPGFVTNQTFPRDQGLEYGPSDYDAKHYFVLNGVWDLPFLRSRKDVLGRLLGGWQLSGILSAHSGFPWTPVSFKNCLTTSGNQVICPVRPVGFSGGAGSDGSNDTFLTKGGNFPGGGEQFFDVTASGVPGIGRNSFRGPHYFTIDMTVGKDFTLPWFFSEEAKLNFRANFFNLFNHTNLAPFGFASPSTVVENQFFGVATNGLAGRVIEFQTRLQF